MKGRGDRFYPLRQSLLRRGGAKPRYRGAPLALAWAEALGIFDIGIGANALDYSGYPDCRPEYLRAFEAMANLATKAGVEGRQFHVHAPLLSMTKAEIVRRGLELGVDYGLTHSCYDPDRQASRAATATAAC